MIEKFQVKGLNGEFDFSFNLQPDLNIITGKNGVGKTTVLKLIYYIISGNLEKLVPEIPFTYVRLDGPQYHISIEIPPGQAANEIATIEFRSGKSKSRWQIPTKSFVDEQKLLHPPDFLIADANAASVFFPTFRRVEGGFTIGKTSRNQLYAPANLQGALSELAKNLTFRNNQFVSSISTDDIETLLTDKYADRSQQLIRMQSDLSETIEQLIKDYKNEEAYAEDTENLSKARTILTEIQEKVRGLEANRTMILKPFETLNHLILELMQAKGVKIRDITTFGNQKKPIEAQKLSAGEKQMLSFLCYNSFVHDAVILIDEPEISLHVDWQRVLFPKLLEQGSSNQFIVATHSPFIYSKYPEKEIRLDQDRGASDA